MDERTLSFLQLRDYAKNEYLFSTGRKWTGFNADIAAELGYSRYNDKGKMVEAFLSSSGKAFLSPEQARKIADYIGDHEKVRDHAGVLPGLINSFLKAHRYTDGYSNLPVRRGTDGIILEKIREDLEENLWKRSKFVFLCGFHGCGKNYIAVTKANELLYEDEAAEFAYYVDCRQKLTPRIFYGRILAHMEQKECDSMTDHELQRRAAEFLRERNAVIYLEAFESIGDCRTQEQIVNFLLEHDRAEVHSELYVIITSNRRSSSYSFIEGNPKFYERMIHPYEQSDLKQYLDYLEKDEKVRYALSLCDGDQKETLRKFLLERTGNLSFMKRSLHYIVEKITSGEDIGKVIEEFFRHGIYEFEISPLDYLKDLDAESMNLLQTLYLFQRPATMEEIGEISGIAGRKIEDAVRNCYERFFIDVSDKDRICSLAREIIPSVAREHINNFGRYTDIVRNYRKKYGFFNMEDA